MGPATTLDLDFASRLNILTGDNGLGKSFLLDVAWWALTQRWPSEVNSKLPAGLIARPPAGVDATISFAIGADKISVSAYDRREQGWTEPRGPSRNRALVLYAMVDGSFAVWDPARNFPRTAPYAARHARRPAYVFNPREVWEGLPGDEGRPLCNGLILDWAGWQKEGSHAFKSLCSVLAALSPSKVELITPGELTRISLDDPRDIPTLLMPYGDSVPVLYASAGMRRIIALAYLLVWSWVEHVMACILLDEWPASQVVFLIDEIEAHLHPRWQRSIVKSILAVTESLGDDGYMIRRAEGVAPPAIRIENPASANVQVITTTHSPLVMASIEPYFDRDRDAWFDLDLVSGEGRSHVELTHRTFIRRGDASNWLTSEAFHLHSARSAEAEEALEKAAVALSDENFDVEQARRLDAELRKVLGDTDPFWMSWRFVGEKKGWLP